MRCGPVARRSGRARSASGTHNGRCQSVAGHCADHRGDFSRRRRRMQADLVITNARVCGFPRRVFRRRCGQDGKIVASGPSAALPTARRTNRRCRPLPLTWMVDTHCHWALPILMRMICAANLRKPHGAASRPSCSTFEPSNPPTSLSITSAVHGRSVRLRRLRLPFRDPARGTHPRDSGNCRANGRSVVQAVFWL